MTGPRSASYYEELGRRLRALEPLVTELVPDLPDWYRKYLDAGEYGLGGGDHRRASGARDAAGSRSLLAAGLLPEAKLMELSHAVIGALQEHIG